MNEIISTTASTQQQVEADGDNGDDDDDSCLASLGFMFDALHHKQLKQLVYDEPLNTTINLYTIGEDPGHVQSGQYLWPAAHAASVYITNNWRESLSSTIVIELGAGCGLSGIVASKLSGVALVILTDYDHGSLQLIKDNVTSNSSDASSVSVLVEFLEWGTRIPVSITSQVERHIQNPVNTSSDSGIVLPILLIGTDLLYCPSIVDPLLHSVNQLLSQDRTYSATIIRTPAISKTGKFILVSSFDAAIDVQNEIDRCCIQYKLSVTTIQALNLEKSECAIHSFVLLE